MTGSLSQTRGRPEPGRELDALIAEKVMGFTWDESRCRICGWHLASDVASGCVPDNCSLRPAPAKHADSPAPYSTNITAAWTVVEELNAKERWPEIQFGPLESGELVWHIGLVNPADVQGYASTAPHAICLAALAALSPADDGGAR